MAVTDYPPLSRSRERGQVLPLLVILLALAVAAAVVVTEIGVAAIERARAQGAADAAALAGAASGEPAAHDVARANGAEVIAYIEVGAKVEVEIRYRRAVAIATAEATSSSDAAGGGDRQGLAPAMVAALARADDLLGRSVPVTSGYRSRSEQEALWQGRDENPYPVAPPGTSNHEVGLAIDVPEAFVSTFLVVAREAGLCQPLPQSDPVHFEPCPPTPP